MWRRRPIKYHANSDEPHGAGCTFCAKYKTNLAKKMRDLSVVHACEMCANLIPGEKKAIPNAAQRETAAIPDAALREIDFIQVDADPGDNPTTLLEQKRKRVNKVWLPREGEDAVLRKRNVGHARLSTVPKLADPKAQRPRRCHASKRGRLESFREPRTTRSSKKWHLQSHRQI